jgi:hypothetical protein
MLRFYSYCLGDTTMRASEEGQKVELPHLHQLPLQDVKMHTQRSRYDLNAAKILSVLISQPLKTI